APPARSTTASWGCSWPTPARVGGRLSIGSCTCPRHGPRIRRGVGPPGCPSRSGSGPSRSSPGPCPDGRWRCGGPACGGAADEVYGRAPALRGWLEDRRMAHVLAIKCSELLAVDDGPAKLSAAELAAAVPAEHWVGASAGHGAKGRRLYDWTRIQLH